MSDLELLESIIDPMKALNSWARLPFNERQYTEDCMTFTAYDRRFLRSVKVHQYDHQREAQIWGSLYVIWKEASAWPPATS